MKVLLIFGSWDQEIDLNSNSKNISKIDYL